MKATFDKKNEVQNDVKIIEYKNGNGDFHFHSQIEICIVKSGQLEALVNNKTKLLNPGDICVSQSYDTHVYIPVNSSDFTVILIPPHMCEEFTEEMKGKKISSPFICNPACSKKIMKYIAKAKDEKISRLRKAGYIYLILGTITENLCFEKTPYESKITLLSKILVYIHENYKEPLTLSSIASATGCNKSYISRHFKECLNIGLVQYINIVRLKNAITLMQNKKHTITYCAFESGFNSLRTFYRVFQSEMHTTPRSRGTEKARSTKNL